MDFEFRQLSPGVPLTIVSGALLESSRADCNDATPLEPFGSQGFLCTPTNCHALAYRFKRYHRLELQFSDGKTRRSNVFKTAQLRSDYEVTIGPDDLLVQPQIHLLRGIDVFQLVWVLPSAVLFAVAIMVAGSFGLRRKKPC